jgi:hypothetical protein
MGSCQPTQAEAVPVSGIVVSEQRPMSSPSRKPIEAPFGRVEAKLSCLEVPDREDAREKGLLLKPFPMSELLAWINDIIREAA